MGRNKFDLIIPVVFKDYGMLSRVLRYVMKYIYPVIYTSLRIRGSGSTCPKKPRG